MISSSSMTRIVPLREFAIEFWTRSKRTALLLRGARRRGGVLGGQRQRDREPRSLADRAVAADRPVVLPDDAVGDRQPEAGAAADRLGREERIVDPRQMLGR